MTREIIRGDDESGSDMEFGPAPVGPPGGPGGDDVQLQAQGGLSERDLRYADLLHEKQVRELVKRASNLETREEIANIRASGQQPKYNLRKSVTVENKKTLIWISGQSMTGKTWLGDYLLAYHSIPHLDGDQRITC